MKRKLTLLTTALLLAFALTACGGGANQGAGNGGQNGDALTGGTGSDAGTGTQDGHDPAKSGQSGSVDGDRDMHSGTTGDDLVDDARDALTGAGDLVEDAMDGRNHQGADLDQMVRNGQVHDRDGDLTDLENSVTSGSTHF